MLWLVKHIDAQRHRRVGRVAAVSNQQAMDQAERQWGLALSMTCLRIETRGGVRVLLREQVQERRP